MEEKYHNHIVENAEIKGALPIKKRIIDKLEIFSQFVWNKK